MWGSVITSSVSERVLGGGSPSEDASPSRPAGAGAVSMGKEAQNALVAAISLISWNMGASNPRKTLFSRAHDWEITGSAGEYS